MNLAVFRVFMFRLVIRDVLRPVKRFRITKKSTAVKRARSTDGTLPIAQAMEKVESCGI